MATTPTNSPSVAINGVTYAEFIRRKRKNPKMKNTTWKGYVSYVTKTRNDKQAARIAAQAQQFGKGYFQLDPRQYAARVGQYIGNDPTLRALPPGEIERRAMAGTNLDPISNEQLRREAESLIMPMYDKQSQAITDMIKRRSQEGSSAIQGYTNAFMSQLPQLKTDMGNIWGEARGLQQGASEALGSFVQSQGAALTGEMAAAEAAAGQASTGSQAVGATAAGSTGATAAYDFSTMSRLINQGAGAQTWAASQPAIAGAYGADTMRSFQSDLNRTLEDSLRDLEAKGQESIMDTYESMLGRELTKTQLRDQRRNDLWDREMDKAQLRGARGTAMAGAYGDAVGMNIDSSIAGSALQAGLGADAEGYTQGVTAGMNAAGADKPPQTKAEQIHTRWDAAFEGIVASIADIQTQRTTAGKKPANFQGLIGRVLPMVRQALGGFGLTEGQLRGFARQVLAANGIYPGQAGAQQGAGAGTGAPPTGIQGPVQGGGYTGPPSIVGPGGARIRIPGIPGLPDWF